LPNSFDNIKPDPAYADRPNELGATPAIWYSCNAEGENDHYTRPGIFYPGVLSAQDKKNLVSNIVGAMSGITSPKKSEITNRQLCHFFRADIGMGMAIAQGLGINPEEAMPKQHTPKKQQRYNTKKDR